MIDYNFPLLVGDEEVLTERELTTRVEAGLLMSGREAVRYIVVHCSATRADRDYTAEQLLRDHRTRGFRTVGYHFYIRKSGEVSQHRKLLEVGAHAKPFNRCSIGICYEGGLAPGNGPALPADTRTPAQKEALHHLICRLHRLFPQAEVVGHRDLPGVRKACPCFDVRSVYRFGKATTAET